MFNTNAWNRIRYSVYQPFYDVIANYFRSYRLRSIQTLDLKNDDKILILGAGTGLDLEFLIGFENITAIDITPGMLTKLEERARNFEIHVDSKVMDASNLEFADHSFDAVILHLIVAVIPDPISCMQETERVLKPGGKFTVMDKFINPGKNPSIFRRLINPITTFLATTLNRDIDELLSKTELKKETHEKMDRLFWLIQGSKVSS